MDSGLYVAEPLHSGYSLRAAMQPHGLARGY